MKCIRWDCVYTSYRTLSCILIAGSWSDLQTRCLEVSGFFIFKFCILLKHAGSSQRIAGPEPLSLYAPLFLSFRPRNPALPIFLRFFSCICVRNRKCRVSEITGVEVFIVGYQEKGGDPPGSDNRVADNGTQDPAKVDLFMNKKSSLMKGQAT